MALDPRRIALQGIGYSALFIALQGFVSVEEPQPTSTGVSAPQRVPQGVRKPREDEELLIIITAALQIMDSQYDG